MTAICKRELGKFNQMVRKSPDDPNLYCFEAYPCEKCSRCVMCNFSDICSQCSKSKEKKLKEDRRKVSLDLRRIHRQNSKEFYVDTFHKSSPSEHLKEKKSSKDKSEMVKSPEINYKRRSKSLESFNEEI